MYRVKNVNDLIKTLVERTIWLEELLSLTDKNFIVIRIVGRLPVVYRPQTTYTQFPYVFSYRRHRLPHHVPFHTSELNVICLNVWGKTLFVTRVEKNTMILTYTVRVFHNVPYPLRCLKVINSQMLFVERMDFVVLSLLKVPNLRYPFSLSSVFKGSIQFTVLSFNSWNYFWVWNILTARVPWVERRSDPQEFTSVRNLSGLLELFLHLRDPGRGL